MRSTLSEDVIDQIRILEQVCKDVDAKNEAAGIEPPDGVPFEEGFKAILLMYDILVACQSKQRDPQLISLVASFFPESSEQDILNMFNQVKAQSSSYSSKPDKIIDFFIAVENEKQVSGGWTPEDDTVARYLNLLQETRKAMFAYATTPYEIKRMEKISRKYIQTQKKHAQSLLNYTLDPEAGEVID